MLAERRELRAVLVRFKTAALHLSAVLPPVLALYSCLMMLVLCYSRQCLRATTSAIRLASIMYQAAYTVLILWSLPTRAMVLVNLLKFCVLFPAALWCRAAGQTHTKLDCTVVNRSF